MKLIDTAVRLYSSNSQMGLASAEESLRYWLGNNPGSTDKQAADRFSISTRAADLMELSKPKNNSSADNNENINDFNGSIPKNIINNKIIDLVYNGCGIAEADNAPVSIFLTDSGSVSSIEQMNILV